ncbi:MAG: hypothetical protein ACRER2_13100 [Methylococcales bacterium]
MNPKKTWKFLLTGVFALTFTGFIFSGAFAEEKEDSCPLVPQILSILNNAEFGNYALRYDLDFKANQESVDHLQADVTGMKSTVKANLDKKISTRASQKSVFALKREVENVKNAVNSIPIPRGANHAWTADLGKNNSILSPDIFFNDGKVRNGRITVGIFGRERDSAIVNLICKVDNNNGTVKIAGQQMLNTDFTCNNIQIEAVDPKNTLSSANVYFSMVYTEHEPNRDPDSEWLK